MSVESTRLLMVRIRELMEANLPSSARLNAVTAALVHCIGCDVSLLYARRGDYLELVAAEGLSPHLVGKLRIPVGRGVVGWVARRAQSINLADCTTHPNYQLIPDLGEEPYHGFLCVALIYSGETIGVLALMKRARSSFSSDEEETLRTVSTVLAQHIAGERAARGGDGAALPVRVAATGLSEGVAVGRVVLHRPRLLPVFTVADDVAVEREKLARALEGVRREVDDMLVHPVLLRDDDHREMIEAFRMFANDRGWARSMEAGVEAGITAEAAVMAASEQARARSRQIADPMLREWMHDIDDLAQRIMHHLRGVRMEAGSELPPDAVLLARSMGPASLLEYDRSNLAALVLGEGGRGSHIAVLARGFGIPAVSGAERVLEQARNGEEVVVNGNSGVVFLRPRPEVVRGYREGIERLRKSAAWLRAARHGAATTIDGKEIAIKLNCGLQLDTENFEDSGAVSVGLFRTEVLFMSASHLPSVSEQRLAYRQIYDNLGGVAVRFRTVDVGGDKVLPYLRRIDQPNPAMGWRAMRLSLDRPGLIRHQLRALLQAADGRELHVMFPMITVPREFHRAREYMQMEMQRHQRAGGKMPAKLHLGIMIEVPSVIWHLRDLLPLVDFISVGTNDLFQFIYAVDRDNSKLQGRYEQLGLAHLTVLRDIHQQAQAHDVPVDVCGDIASDPYGAMALLGLGYTSLSVPARAVGAVKQAVRAADTARLRSLVETALQEDNLRQLLLGYAKEAGISLARSVVHDLPSNG